MIQAGRRQKLRYASRLIPHQAPGARLARATQSAAAEVLLQELRADADEGGGASSKSHSRALVAAAYAPTGRIGIDVEFHAPGRRIREIANYLMDATPRDEAAAYRVFTFYEAYFKAVGAFPEPALMRAVASCDEDRATVADVNVLHARIERDFTLTLVWSGSDL